VALLRYCAPTTLAEAAVILEGNRGAKVLAGGTDLLVQMRLGLRDPSLVVDIKRIPELMAYSLDEAGLQLGAAVPGVIVTGNPALRRCYPGFVEALGLIGSSQIQGRCSAGGNLCNGAMIVNRAVCHIVGPVGSRRVAVENFATGPGSNCLSENELLVSIDFPLPPPRSSDAYLRFIPRTEMDIAVAGAAVAMTLDQSGICTAARVAIGAVAPTARLVPAAADALIGTTLDADALARAAAAAGNAASPITDKRGTADYRKKVVGVLVRRAATLAKARIVANS